MLMTTYQKFLPLVLSVAAFVLQMLTPNVLGFHRDELLYFSMADHPAAGYFSVPPFTGLVAWLSVKLFGYTLFASKFLPALAGSVLIYFISLITRELRGGIYAMALAALSFICSLIFIRAFSLFQPVPFDILFWTVILYLFIRFINTRNPDIILVIGFVTGVAFLNKYNILFLILGIVLAVFFSKYRKLLLSRHVLIAVVITFIIALPNIIWQYLHDFPVISHMLELRDSQLVNMNPVTFIVEQLLMVMPASIVIFPGLLWILISKKMKEYRIVAMVCISVLVLYILFQGKTYYSAGIYGFLAAVGGVATENLIRNKLIRVLPFIIMLFFGMLMFPMGKPVFNPEGLVTYFDRVEQTIGNDAIRRDEDNNYNKLPQDYSDMLGWDQLVEITASVWENCDPKTSVIYCENYGQAGAIAVLGKRYGLPAPVCFSESFLYWSPKSFENEITTLIYINNEMGDDVKDQFSQITIIDSISNSLARERGTTVYLCQNPKTSFNKFYAEVVSTLKF